jgi:hypothetical protein
MTDTTQAARVIAAFGGRAQMARDTHYTYAILNRWWHTGYVPGDVLDLAHDLGRELSLSDLFAHLVDPAERAKQSTATAA